MSKKNITNEDVVNEAREQEVIEVEAKDAEQTEKPSEPETKEVTTKEEKVPFRKRKAFKVIAAVGAGLAGVTVVGAKLISSFGNKKWDEGYEEGWHDGQDTWPGPSEPEEPQEIETQEEIEYPEDE